ncbi:unnamed protein product [Discosporangium mesarthrocarpum]
MSVVRLVRLRVPAGAAKPGPAIGQALGPLGINMVEFCKKFNDATQHVTPNTPTPVVLSAMSDRTFTFEIKSPPTTWLLKRCAGIEKGVSRPGHESEGRVGLKTIYEIASIKKKDDHLWHLPLEGLCRSVIATANSMGVTVYDDRQNKPAAA